MDQYKYIKYLNLVKTHQVSFSEACTLFQGGNFYGAIGAFNRMFDRSNVCSAPTVEFVWCDHLPTLSTTYGGLVSFMKVGDTVTCMIQCEQLRANTILPFGLCHAANLVCSAVQMGATLSAKPMLFDAADGSLSITPRKVSYCSSFRDDLLVMDPEFAFSNGYAAVREECREFDTWMSRQDKVLWRGSTTGQSTLDRCLGTRQPENKWDRLQRLELCELVARSKHADILDVGISNVVQLSEKQAERVRRSGFMRPAVNRNEFGTCRYTIDVDGNSNAWSSFFTKLLMGCCVIKIGSRFDFRQWYYDDLEPWKHYVPVAADLSDFDDALDRLRSDIKMGESIAAHGQTAAMGLTLEKSFQHSIQTLVRFDSST